MKPTLSVTRRTKDGRHKLSNGSLFTIEGFTKRGDIVVDHGWVIDRHLTHGYCLTSHPRRHKRFM